MSNNNNNNTYPQPSDPNHSIIDLSASSDEEREMPETSQVSKRMKTEGPASNEPNSEDEADLGPEEDNLGPEIELDSLICEESESEKENENYRDPSPPATLTTTTTSSSNHEPSKTYSTWSEINEPKKNDLTDIEPSSYDLKMESVIFYIDFGNMPPGNKAIFSNQSGADDYLRNLKLLFYARKRYSTVKRLLLKEMSDDLNLSNLIVNESSVSSYLEKYPKMNLKLVNEYKDTFTCYNTIYYYDSFFVDESLSGNDLRGDRECKICDSLGKLAYCKGVISHICPEEGKDSVELCDDLICEDCFQTCSNCGGKVCYDPEYPLLSCSRKCPCCGKYYCNPCYKGDSLRKKTDPDYFIRKIDPSCEICKEEVDSSDACCFFCDIVHECQCGCGKNVCDEHMFECPSCNGYFVLVNEEEFHHKRCEVKGGEIDPYNEESEGSSSEGEGEGESQSESEGE